MIILLLLGCVGARELRLGPSELEVWHRRRLLGLAACSGSCRSLDLSRAVCIDS